MSRRWFFWGAVLGALGVALGAFGAHGLRAWLPLQKMTIFETAVRYHMFHALAMLAVAAAEAQFPARAARLNTAGGLFAAGIVLFSGSLYLWALTDVSLFPFITPVGGLALVAGWLAAAAAFWGRDHTP